MGAAVGFVPEAEGGSRSPCPAEGDLGSGRRQPSPLERAGPDGHGSRFGCGRDAAPAAGHPARIPGRDETPR
ncbi:hypothetical protein G6F68_017971 [Rhizopus microsporus]|nr:hypothetical protein G6F68_017971 [Rhizopus microsporus]